ncbi:MAG: GNAT family N-acetyltransferase, partial [Amnibacterium sp.]
MTATIRPGTEADLPRLGAIAAASLDLDPEDAAELPRLLWAEDEGTRRVRLVAVEDEAPVGVLLGSLQGADAFLDLILVAAEARNRGIAKALLGEWEQRAADAGATRSLAGENFRTYAWPGVDIRYTPALAMLLRAGYARTRVVYNMDLPLTGAGGRHAGSLETNHTRRKEISRGPPQENSNQALLKTPNILD